jgi:hypothetical protein
VSPEGSGAAFVLGRVRPYDDLVDHCCEAWNKLTDRPWRIMSVGCASGPTGSDQRDLAELKPGFFFEGENRTTVAFMPGVR